VAIDTVAKEPRPIVRPLVQSIRREVKLSLESKSLVMDRWWWVMVFGPCDAQSIYIVLVYTEASKIYAKCLVLVSLTKKQP
jgi:hypothetical protein